MLVTSESAVVPDSTLPRLLATLSRVTAKMRCGRSWRLGSCSSLRPPCACAEGRGCHLQWVPAGWPGGRQIVEAATPRSPCSLSWLQHADGTMDRMTFQSNSVESDIPWRTANKPPMKALGLVTWINYK